MKCYIFLCCLMGTAFLGANPQEEQQQVSSHHQMSRYCPCGCGCTAPCRCGCMQGKPCTCPK